MHSKAFKVLATLRENKEKRKREDKRITVVRLYNLVVDLLNFYVILSCLIIL